MPTMRKNIRSQYSSYGFGISGSSRGLNSNPFVVNAKRSAARQTRTSSNWQPTFRGSIPSTPVSTNWSPRTSRAYLGASTLRPANSAGRTYSFGAANARSAYDGNAARQLESAAPKPKFSPDYSPKPNKTRKVQLEAIRGQKRNGGILEGTALSPLIVTAAKFAAVIVFAAAITAFGRVAISSASVTTGIDSKQLTTQITDELATKNQLEVQDSAIANSSHIRSAAEKYSLVTPSSIEQINLGQDVVAYDNAGNVSLVESLKRVQNA